MADVEQAANAAALERLSASIERWRRTRTKLSAMPEPLWREAVAVSRRAGVSAVATACGLNATRLKARVEASTSTARPARAAAPARFVELSAAQVLGGAQPAGDAIVLELTDGRGGRMSVRVPRGASGDVARWVEAFRRTTA